jgi:hypothetical protein
MATVTKNFRIKSGLIVEGTSGTIDGHNILTESTSGDQYILNLVGGATLVKSVDSGVFTVDNAGNLTINSNTFDSYGSASAAQSAAESYADGVASAAQAAAEQSAQNYANTAESNAVTTAALDATNKANQALSDAQGYANSLASNYDPAGSAATAQSNAESYADTAISNLNLPTTYDAYGAASQAETNANNYTDGAISGLSGNATAVVNGHLDVLTGTGIAVNNNAIEVDFSELDTHYDAYGAASSAQTAAQSYADTAATNAENAAKAYTDQEVAALVDGAPALLDTLNELAAAIADNPSYATDVANLVSTKADTAYVDSEISDLDTAAQGYATTAENNAKAYADGLAVNYDAAGSASAAQSAAQSYADGLAVNYDAAGSASAAQSAAEATAQAALNDVLDGTTPFTDININDYAKQVAARASSLGSVAVTAYQFNKNSFKSGKFLVKIDNGTHNEISEILVTLDSSDNVAITEYAIVGTNGSRGTITADTDATHCRIRVTPVNDSTITVAGTVFKA